MDPVRIVLVDQTMVRQGLRRLLEQDGTIKVVGEASDAHEGLRTIGSVMCDVVVVDLFAPAQEGIWLARQLKETHPDLPVVVIAVPVEDRLVVEALRAGASSYVLKTSPCQELVDAILQVHQVGFYLNPRLARPVMEELRAVRPVHPRRVGK